MSKKFNINAQSFVPGGGSGSTGSGGDIFGGYNQQQNRNAPGNNNRGGGGDIFGGYDQRGKGNNNVRGGGGDIFGGYSNPRNASNQNNYGYMPNQQFQQPPQGQYAYFDRNQMAPPPSQPQYFERPAANTAPQYPPVRAEPPAEKEGEREREGEKEVETVEKKVEETKPEEAEDWEEDLEKDLQEKAVVEEKKQPEPEKKEEEAPKKVAETHLDFTKDDDVQEALEEALEEEEEQQTYEEKSTTDSSGKILKRNLNVIFMGHVDAGKSTISGQIMWQTGNVDPRLLEKYEREAKAKNRESWKFAWLLDENEEEREKGKTHECGLASFELEKKRYTIIDSPGHKAFVPEMIGGAAQADVGILVISARRGEFETGFERGGQTREHAVLAKTSGVRQLVVVINKMDEPSVKWSKERYDECVTKLTPFLKQAGFNPKTQVTFLPVSGLTGLGIKDPIPEETCAWWKGETLLATLDEMETPERLLKAPVRLPIVDKYKEMGSVVMGKLESGCISVGEKLKLMPSGSSVEVVGLSVEGHELTSVEPGDQVRIRVKGVDEDDLHPGMMLCSESDVCEVASVVVAQVVILECKSIICAGYTAMMHIHGSSEEVTFKKLMGIVDRRKNEITQKFPKFVKPGQTALVQLEFANPMCLETTAKMDRLGRFAIRDEGKTIAVGMVKKVLS